MNMDKVTAIIGATIGITIGVSINSKIINNRNHETRQAEQQVCRDIYKNPSFDAGQGELFAKKMEQYKLRTDAYLQKLLSENKFSNTNIMVNSNFDLGHLVIRNCNTDDVEKLKKLLQISPNKGPVHIIQEEYKTFSQLFSLKTKNNKIVHFALDDIGNKVIAKECTEFQSLIQTQLAAYFAETNVTYNKAFSKFHIVPSKKSNIMITQALLFFPDKRFPNKMDLIEFGQHNKWMSYLFFDPGKPISKTIKIPYSYAVKAFKQGLKSIR